MRPAGDRVPAAYLATMMRLIVLAAAVVALTAAGTAYAGASFNQSLHATTGFVTGGHILQTTFSGTGNLPNVGAFSFTGEESDGCPDGQFCSKEFSLALTARNGDTLTISGSWVVECISFDTGVPVSTGLCDNGLPSSIAWTAAGTGRFAGYHGTGSISWSGSPGVPGMPVTLSLAGSVK
jgi:hypothetical protein